MKLLILSVLRALIHLRYNVFVNMRDKTTDLDRQDMLSPNYIILSIIKWDNIRKCNKTNETFFNIS